jgi:hypothetical protein
MDTPKHKLHATVTMHGVWHQAPPRVKIGLNQQEIYHGDLIHTQTFEIEQWLEPGPASIWIEFNNKIDADTVDDKDKAVIIDSIVLNGIASPKFVWAGLYQPLYPAIWHQQQCDQGTTPAEILQYHNYLGWNGKWRLDIAIPVFTWIHQVENLGWIYD